MLRLYNTALAPLRVAVELWARRPLRDPEKRVEWAERRARRLATPRPGGVWIHGASVGEARIVRGLARILRSTRPDLPLAVSSLTPTGRAQLPGPPEVDAAFFPPLDFSGLPTRVLRSVRPAVLSLVETELWPNLVSEASASGVPVVLINGRLSAGRMSRYRRLAALYRPVLRDLARLGVQTEEDAARFVELGACAASVVVTGNVKFDLPEPEVSATALRRHLGLPPGRPVFVAGSTGRGEEALVFQAFEEARRERGDLLLLLAPRHPDRGERVLQRARERGRAIGRLSRDVARLAELDTLLVDTVGELHALYQVGSVAFVGGSLVPVGGHNVLEPAAVGVPVLFGPHTDNVREPAAALERSGAARRVRDASELASALRALLADDDRRATMGRLGRDFVRHNRGALRRSVDLVLQVLDASLPPSAGVA